LIPVFEPDVREEDIEAVTAALRRGELSGSFGEALRSFEHEFAKFVGCSEGIATSSGTTALELAVNASGVVAGDEVLISASTNVATALAVVRNGAIPVPIDSESTTWNLDLDQIEERITPRTKAIIAVHLYGHPVDMDRLNEIATRHGLIVIEDCAESHGATCRGRMTGSFGSMACFSFYANKVITTGEGGMVTTSDPKLADRLRLLRNLAFTTPRFRHEDAGYNFRMTGFQAALGLSQLRRINEVIAAKRDLARRYVAALTGIPGLQLPVEMPWAKNVYWMFAVVVGPTFGLTRDELAERLRSEGIETRTFFCPMNLQPFLQRLPGFPHQACPVADRLWEEGMYLPSTPSLTDDEVRHVGTAIRLAAA
jgi:perosamine synthetase